MSSSASLTSGVAGRYATALFEIAKESKSLDKVEADLLALEAALAESADLRGMIASPVFSREDQGQRRSPRSPRRWTSGRRSPTRWG